MKFHLNQNRVDANKCCSHSRNAKAWATFKGKLVSEELKEFFRKHAL